MTLVEINDICVAKMSEALVEVEVPDEFWHDVYEITKDAIEKDTVNKIRTGNLRGGMLCTGGNYGKIY